MSLKRMVVLALAIFCAAACLGEVQDAYKRKNGDAWFSLLMACALAAQAAFMIEMAIGMGAGE